MSGSDYLVDASALIRLMRNPTLDEAWRPRVDAGLLAVCSLTRLEVLRGARSKAHRCELKQTMDALCCWVVMPERAYERAEDVQESLADQGKQRSAGPIDLVVAAIAEEHDLTLLHYDKDFLHVAAITGQTVSWLASPGSID